MKKDKAAKYRIIVGSDSQKTRKSIYDFVCALIVHRVGQGGIYFWRREEYDKKIGLKERMYREASMSLITAEEFIKKLILICDDSDLPEGKLKLTRNHGAGGHKGLANIFSIFGTTEFLRIKNWD